jgi:hypothetical protein
VIEEWRTKIRDFKMTKISTKPSGHSQAAEGDLQNDRDGAGRCRRAKGPELRQQESALRTGGMTTRIPVTALESFHRHLTETGSAKPT